MIEKSYLKNNPQAGFAVLEIALISGFFLVMLTTVVAVTERLSLHRFANNLLQQSSSQQINNTDVLKTINLTNAAASLLGNYNQYLQQELVSYGLPTEAVLAESAIVRVDADNQVTLLASNTRGQGAFLNQNTSAVVGQYFEDAHFSGQNVHHSQFQNSFLSNNSSDQQSTLFLISRLLIKEQSFLGSLLDIDGRGSEIYSELIRPIQNEYTL